MRKQLFLFMLLLGSITTYSTQTLCMIQKYVLPVHTKDYLTHDWKKHFNRKIKFHKKHKNKASLIFFYKFLRNLELNNYEKLSKKDIDWFDEKIEILEAVVKTLNFNIDYDINNPDKKELKLSRKAMRELNHISADVDWNLFLKEFVAIENSGVDLSFMD